ncbi:MAG TPA: HEAT repeat domain-containing protein [Phycisphaerae bacterium]|nr:HEAT repeat domain-containing protein [Phycisphaerae bacterium]
MSALLAIAGLATLPPPVCAEPPQKMLFKNNTLPGHLTQHLISRVIQRTSRRKKYVETLEYKQQAAWIQCNIDESKPGTTVLYQMMADQPAEVVRVLHGKKKVEPTPPAEDFSLAAGSTRLQSTNATPRDAPIQVPLTESVERVLLQSLLDFAHWPAKSVEAGHRWQRDIDFGSFKGTQTFEFVDIAKVNGQSAARLTLYVEGKFAGPLEKDYVFDKGQAIIYWSRPDRALLKMEAQAFYRRLRERSLEEYKLKLDVGLIKLEMLTEKEQDTIRDQLTVFATALKNQREGQEKDALGLCRQFREKWPKSMWLPAVDDLVRQMTPRVVETKRYSPEELRETLVKTVVAYEAARTNGEYDYVERTRRVLEGLAVDYHATLKKLAQNEDDAVRSQAVFALAFGKRPDDLVLVQKAARDESPRVRAMALAGLAARRSPDVSAELLASLLDDEKPVVRRRACEVVAACMTPEHFSAVQLVGKLDHLMVFDDNDAVRLAAIRALAAIGTPADIPKFEKALTHELNQENRAEIERSIEKLKARG